MSEPRRVHALTLLPGDRFRFELDGPEYEILKVGSIYMVRITADPNAPRWTFTAVMGRNGLMVFPISTGD